MRPETETMTLYDLCSGATLNPSSPTHSDVREKIIKIAKSAVCNAYKSNQRYTVFIRL